MLVRARALLSLLAASFAATMGCGDCGAPQRLREDALWGTSSIVVDATHVLAPVGGIARVPKAGGDAETLVSVPRPDGVAAVAVDATSITYVLARTTTGPAAFRVPKSGGAPQPLLPITSPPEVNPQAVTSDAQHVYVASCGRRSRMTVRDACLPQDQQKGEPFGVLRRVRHDGSDAVTLVDDLRNPSSLVDDPTHVYLVEWGTRDPASGEAGDGRLRRLDKTTGAVGTLATGLVRPLWPALRGDHIFFLDGGDVVGIPKAGGARTVVVAEATRFTIGNGNVYFVRTRRTGEVDHAGRAYDASWLRSKPVAGGDEVLLLELGGDTIFGMAADAEHLYFTRALREEGLFRVRL